MRLPIGLSDFRELRLGGYGYVDKTGLIRDVVRSSAHVLLFPRPRRFGKTLNMSMLQAFLEKSETDASPLFEGLSIFRDSAADCREHFQRYPVLFLSFKDVKESTFALCFDKVKALVAQALRPHESRLLELAYGLGERDRIMRLIDRTATRIDVEFALNIASRELARAYGEKVVILIDEYDTPIQAGFLNGYYDEVVSLFRNFLSGGLKDNPHLWKGVLTGVLAIAKESLFSGLNNLAVYSMLRPEFSSYFGFTEDEVEALADELGQVAHMAEIRKSYNGYLFGGRKVYNPWSVISFLASEDKRYRPYWASTSGNDLLHEMLIERGARLGGEMEVLLHGEAIDKPIEEHTALRELTLRPDAVWSLLLMSGYLKAEGPTGEDVDGTPIYRLSIPNKEVDGTYRSVFLAWIERNAGSRADAGALVEALLAGDAETFEALLEELIGRVLSYHDVGGREAEKVFQAFILGLLTVAEPRYEVRSNRESGRGRYDVMVLPREPGKPGVVLELKVVNARRGETAEEALRAALAQIVAKDYASELRARGATPVHLMAAVLEGKRVRAEKG